MKKIKFIFTIIAVLALLTSVIQTDSYAQVNYNQGWDDAGAGLAGWTATGGSVVRFTGTTVCTGTGSVRTNLYDVVPANTFTSPSLGTSNGGLTTLTFEYKVANWSANTVGTPCASFTIAIEWSNSLTGTWIPLGTIDCGNHVVAGTCALGPGTYQFTPVTGDQVFLRFVNARFDGDFFINFDEVLVVEQIPPCTGIPNPGNTLTTVNPVGTLTNFILSLENATAGTGVTYQWQSSLDGSAWDNVGPDAPEFTTTQTTDTYYRCEVTCDGSTGTSLGVFVEMAQPLSGNYTINSTLPTGGTNFTDFTDFASAANLGGLAGPVVVDVVTGTGPYTEQIMLEEIPNSSAVNTLTINGNGETLQFLSTTTGARHTFALNGTDYVTVNDLIIIALGNVTGEFGWAVWLANAADYITFNNCEFHASTTATLGNFNAFVTSNSATLHTTAGLAASNLTIDGCKAVGGFYGMIINGPTSAPYAENNVVKNTEITDFHSYGLYLRGQNNGLFTENEISRPTRTTTTILYMLYVTQDKSGTEITKNRISGFSTVASTSTAYGIYGTTINATVTEELLIANNLIYGFENMNGTQYGMYMLTTSNTKFYHNTVSLDNVSHTGSSLIRAFHQSGTGSVVDIQNNIFSVTSNSTGTKYCMYFGTAAATVNSDNNVLHMGAASGTNHIAYKSTSFTTLADWQAAESSIYDQYSKDVNPMFVDAAAGDLEPQAIAINDMGANLLSEVPDDIFGVARTANPDPGAIEFVVSDYNAAIIEITSPEMSNCGLAVEQISAVVKNLGALPITSIELGYIVNSNAPVKEVFSGINIGSDGVDTLTFNVGFDFSALGSYSITVFANLAGDTLNHNDTLSNYVINNSYDLQTSDYFMGFEQDEDFSDWLVIDANADNRTWEPGHFSTTYANTGTRSARFFQGTTAIGNDWLISPCFYFEAGNVYDVEFWYRVESATYPHTITLLLGNDKLPASFIDDTLVYLNLFNNTQYMMASVRVSVTTSDFYYFGWHATSPAQNYWAYIDDITIRQIPNQEAALVEIVNMAQGCGLENEVVEVAIVNKGAQVITADFNVSYQITGSSTIVTETVSAPNIAVFDTMYYEFTTLADFSTTVDSIFVIKAWVSLPGDPIADNDTAWTNVNSKHIPQIVISNDTIPYGASATLTAVADYEIFWYDDINATNLIHQGNTYVLDAVFNDTTLYIKTESGSSENVGKPIYDGTGNSTGGTDWGLLFDVVNSDVTINTVDVYSVGSGGQMEVQLRDNTGSIITTVGPFTYPAGSTANPVQVTFPLNLNVPIGTGYRLVSSLMSGALIREFAAVNNFPYESPSGNVIITSGFYFGTTNSYYWFYNWVLEVEGCESEMLPISAIIETPICYFVTNVNVDNSTQSTAQVSFTPGGSETAWALEFGEQGYTQGTGVVDTSFLTTYTFEGLSAGYTYDFYIKALCGTTNSIWVGPYQFKAECNEYAVPLFENFDNVITPELPICWNAIVESTSPGAAVITFEQAGLNYSDPNSIMMYGGTDFDVNAITILTTPEMANDLDELYVKFYARHIDASNLILGSMSDPTDASTFNAIETFNLTNNYEAYSKLFKGINTTDKYIAFMQTQDNFDAYVLLDDISIDKSLIVNYVAGPNGHITGQATQYLIHGTNTEPVFAEPNNTCYTFEKWSDGRTDNPRFDMDVNADFTVLAQFKLRTIEHWTTEVICDGDTYLFGDLQNQELTVAGDYTGSFITPDGCDSTVYLTLIVNPSYEFVQNATICQGQSFTWHGNIYYSAGTYYAHYLTQEWCDSIYVLNLYVKPTFEHIQQHVMCQGETYTWRGNDYTVSGTYYDAYQNQYNCDSIYVLELTVNPTYFFEETLTACDEYLWRGHVYTQSGVYYDSLQTAQGCPFVYKLNLTINSSFLHEEDVTICDNIGGYEWRGNIYNVSGAYYDYYTSTKNCDSIYVLHLVVNPAHTFVYDVTICDNEGGYEWRGDMYYNQGVYYDSLLTINDCDSVFVLNLTVNPTYEYETHATICDNTGGYIWRGMIFNQTGTYYDSYMSELSCDSVYVLHLVVNPTYEFIQNEAVCEGINFNWRGGTYNVAGTYFDSLQTVNSCDSVYVLNLTFYNNITVLPVYEDICNGEVFPWRGNTYDTTGIYRDTLFGTDPSACYIVNELHLTVNPTFADTLTMMICQGNAFEWYGTFYTDAGYYTENFLTINNCDSIEVLELIVNPSYIFADSVVMCDNGQGYLWRDSVYMVSGMYFDSLTTIGTFCDSIYVLNLTINPTYEYVMYDTICEGDVYVWFADGNDYTTTGTYNAVYQTIHNCDSIYILHLTVNPVYEIIEHDAICAGNIYTWRGYTLTAAGTYYDYLQTVDGCDSTYVLHLVVNQPTTATITEIVCNSYTAPDNQVYTQSGVYTAFITNAAGCDSIITIHLTVNYSTVSTITEVVCDSYTAPDGQVYTTSGIYTVVIPNAAVCDSTITIDLTVHNSSISTITEVVCDSYTAPDGQVYLTSGVYTAVIPNAAGCDSTITINLTVKYASSSTISATVCDSYTAPDGQVYLTSGVYTAVIPNAVGCDSTIIISLVVDYTMTSTTNKTICDGDVFAWRGNNYTAAGTYYDSLVPSYGCPIIYVLNLNVNPSYTFEHTEIICDGDVFTWRGTDYTDAGTYYDAFQTINDCDSIYMLNLIVKPHHLITDDVAICDGSIYTWRGTDFTVSGVYYDSLYSAFGCDSVFMLNLTVNDVFEYVVYDTICEGDTYGWFGNYYTLEDTYYHVLQTQFDCDSTFVLHLTVFDLPVVMISGLNSEYCEYNAAVTMAGTPVGGTFSGPGVSGNVFDPSVAGLGTWTIIYTYTDGNACVNSAEVTVVVDECASIEDGNTANLKINVYPNPSNGNLMIELHETTALTVYNALGAVIYYNSFTEGTHPLNFNHLANGVYFIKAESAKTFENIRIVIQK